MITLILGRKGSGKTKRLIDMCNAATAESKGSVVFIEKDSSLTYDISRQARLAVAEDYQISGYDAFYGFIAGMCASNYDITDIFVDSTIKIGGDNRSPPLSSGWARCPKKPTPMWCCRFRRTKRISPSGSPNLRSRSKQQTGSKRASCCCGRACPLALPGGNGRKR